VTGTFSPPLDEVVRVAAARAGVHFVDMTNAFAGARICETRPGAASAVNIVQLDRPQGSGVRVSSWLHGSFHPTQRGHQLMAGVLRTALDRNPSEAPNPAPDPTARLSTPAPAPAATPEPDVVPDAGPCKTRPDYVLALPVASPGHQAVTLDDAEPGSTVCFRDAGRRWATARADGNGDVTVDVTPTGTSNSPAEATIMYTDELGRWTAVIVTSVQPQ
jgi:hypothetical protein